MRNSLKLLLVLVLFICGSQANEFNIEDLVQAYGHTLLTLLEKQHLVQQHVGDAAQCLAVPATSASINEFADCSKQNYPQIPADIANDFLNAKNVRFSVCDLPDGDAPGFAAIGLGDQDVSGECPEGELYAFDAPLLIKDRPAVYTSISPISITYLQDGDSLATVSDPDGAITSAVTSSTMPSGTYLTPSTGAIVVNNRNMLRPGSYNVPVTTTDSTGGKTTQTINFVLLAAMCGQLSACGQSCYYTTEYDCVDYQLIRKGTALCGGAPYDAATYVCVGNKLCPSNFPLLCGNACYRSAEYGCCDSQLCLVGINCGC